MKRLIPILCLPLLVWQNIGSASEETIKQAITCSAIFFVFTAVPKDALMEVFEVSEIEASEFNRQSRQAGQAMNMIASANVDGGLSIGQLAKGREMMVESLTMIYEDHSPTIIEYEAMRCNRWFVSLLQYFSEHQTELEGSDDAIIKTILLEAPPFPLEFMPSELDEQSAAMSVIVGFESFIALGKPSYFDIKEKLRKLREGN